MGGDLVGSRRWRRGKKWGLVFRERGELLSLKTMPLNSERWWISLTCHTVKGEEVMAC
jgi:hypothetical protein